MPKAGAIDIDRAAWMDFSSSAASVDFSGMEGVRDHIVA